MIDKLSIDEIASILEFQISERISLLNSYSFNKDHITYRAIWLLDQPDIYEEAEHFLDSRNLDEVVSWLVEQLPNWRGYGMDVKIYSYISLPGIEDIFIIQNFYAYYLYKKCKEKAKK